MVVLTPKIAVGWPELHSRLSIGHPDSLPLNFLSSYFSTTFSFSPLEMLFLIIVLCTSTNIVKQVTENLHVHVHVGWKILLAPTKKYMHLCVQVCMPKIEHCQGDLNRWFTPLFFVHVFKITAAKLADKFYFSSFF